MGQIVGLPAINEQVASESCRLWHRDPAFACAGETPPRQPPGRQRHEGQGGEEVQV